MSVRRSPVGAGLLQEGWLPLGSHARGYLLELADEAGLAVVIRAHLVHELVPVVRKPGSGKASLRPAEVFHRGGVLLALACPRDAQTERAPQPGGLFRVRLVEGFRRLNDTVARVTQIVVGARVDGTRSEEHTSELQSHLNLLCRLLLEKNTNNINIANFRRASQTG